MYSLALGTLTVSVLFAWGSASAQHAGLAPERLHPSVFRTAENISAEELRGHAVVLSADEMGGRHSPSPGLDRAAEYIAGRLAEIPGIRPAGANGTFFQPFQVRVVRALPERMYARINDRVFTPGEGFLVPPLSWSADGVADSPLVYVGEGWRIPSRGIDPYRGVDVNGKIVIMSGHSPTPQFSAISALPYGVGLITDLGRHGVDYEYPREAAERLGAKGIIMFPPPPQAAQRWANFRNRMFSSRTRVYPALEARSEPHLPEIIASTEMLETLFSGEPYDAAELQRRAITGEFPESFELLPGKRAVFSTAWEHVEGEVRNVIALVEGSDSILKNEYVVIGGHYDGLGIRPAVNGDSIWNGADDNASGSAGLIEIAKAFAAGPRPKRSILLIWHAAEEQRHGGARYFTQYPTVRIENVVTYINMDMIGRSRAPGDTSEVNASLTGPQEIDVMGPPLMSTDLVELVDAVNQSFLGLSYNYRYNEPPFFYHTGSDHFHYASRGIPVVFYFSGTHEDFHGPTDTADKLDYGKMEAVSRTIFATAWAIAEAPTRPRIDREPPPAWRAPTR